MDVNSATQGGDTPLHWAVIERHTAVVRLLLQQQNVDVLIVNQRGDTAASLAKSVGSEIGRLVAEREEQQRQQQQQRQSESGAVMSTFAVSSTAAAAESSGGAPKKKMTIKLKPKK